MFILIPSLEEIDTWYGLTADKKKVSCAYYKTTNFLRDINF